MLKNENDAIISRLREGQSVTIRRTSGAEQIARVARVVPAPKLSKFQAPEQAQLAQFAAVWKDPGRSTGEAVRWCLAEDIIRA